MSRKFHSDMPCCFMFHFLFIYKKTPSQSFMNSTTNMEEIAFFNFPPFLRLYKDSGRVERLRGTETVPPSFDPNTKVSSKDIVIDPQTGVSARLYLPCIDNLSYQKLPLLVYFHGGGFCIGSAFSPSYHNYLNPLASLANAIVVSVEYRLVPEYPLPVAFNDSWTALQWIASHSSGSGSELWLNNHVDFSRVFFAGDSAGATIAHNMGMRITQLPKLNLVGIALIHPFFCGTNLVGSEGLDHLEAMEKTWTFVYPTSSGCDDPVINPETDPNLTGLGCTRVLVCVAEKDMLRERGWYYYETLRKSGWGGNVEFMEAEGETHIFHIHNPGTEKALQMMKKVALFINQE